MAYVYHCNHITLDHADVVEAVKEWTAKRFPELLNASTAGVTFWVCKGNSMVAPIYDLAARLTKENGKAIR